MPMRLNPPPGWPPVPPGWAPQPGWQPDPSWPPPPPGWKLWIDDALARAQQQRAATWLLAGGGAMFLGAILPFVSSSDPGLYTISPAPKVLTALLGLVLLGLGVIMRAGSLQAAHVSGVIALILVGIAALGLVALVWLGTAGYNITAILGMTVHVRLSLQAGLFIACLSCVPAGVGPIMFFSRR